jgi:hypothetical protein
MTAEVVTTATNAMIARATGAMTVAKAVVQAAVIGAISIKPHHTLNRVAKKSHRPREST